MKENFFYFLILVIIVFASYISFQKQSANLAQSVATPLPEPLCENFSEVGNFEKPVPVVWTAKIDGCLASCEGASFTRVPEDKQYPRFAGYYPGGLGDWLKEDMLKISGEWIGIDGDHPFTVFDNKCVPVVQIRGIEAIK